MNNTPEQIARFEWFKFGWAHRRALALDSSGAPEWLIRRRCGSPSGFFALVDCLLCDIDPGHIPYYVQDKI